MEPYFIYLCISFKLRSREAHWFFFFFFGLVFGRIGKDIRKFLIGHRQYKLSFGVIPVLLLSLQKIKQYDEGNPGEIHLIYWALFLFNHSLKGFRTVFLLRLWCLSSVRLTSHVEWGWGWGDPPMKDINNETAEIKHAFLLLGRESSLFYGGWMEKDLCINQVLIDTLSTSGLRRRILPRWWQYTVFN